MSFGFKLGQSGTRTGRAKHSQGRPRHSRVHLLVLAVVDPFASKVLTSGFFTNMKPRLVGKGTASMANAPYHRCCGRNGAETLLHGESASLSAVT
jgi:hypothetical protein